MLRASSTRARTGPAIQQTPDRWLEINEQLNLCHRTKTRGDYREQRDKPTRLCPGRPLQTFAVPTSKRPCLPECFLRFIRGSIFPGQAGGAELPSLGVALGQYRREPGMWLLQLPHPGCGHREDGSSASQSRDLLDSAPASLPFSWKRCQDQLQKKPLTLRSSFQSWLLGQATCILVGNANFKS